MNDTEVPALFPAVAALPAERLQPPQAGADSRAPRHGARAAAAGSAALQPRRHRALRQAARAQVRSGGGGGHPTRRACVQNEGYRFL